MRYPDYTETSSGLQYKDLRLGSGPIPKTGDMVVDRSRERTHHYKPLIIELGNHRATEFNTFGHKQQKEKFVPNAQDNKNNRRDQTSSAQPFATVEGFGNYQSST